MPILIKILFLVLLINFTLCYISSSSNLQNQPYPTLTSTSAFNTYANNLNQIISSNHPSISGGSNNNQLILSSNPTLSTIGTTSTSNPFSQLPYGNYQLIINNSSLPNIVISFDQTSIGFQGCSSYSLPYIMQANKFIINGNINPITKNCQQNSNDQKYLNFLCGINGYTMSGNNLYLKRGGENVATCMYKNNNVFASARAQTNIGMGLSSRPLLGGKIQLGRRIQMQSQSSQISGRGMGRSSSIGFASGGSSSMGFASSSSFAGGSTQFGIGSSVMSSSHSSSSIGGGVSMSSFSSSGPSLIGIQTNTITPILRPKNPVIQSAVFIPITPTVSSIPSQQQLYPTPSASSSTVAPVPSHQIIYQSSNIPSSSSSSSSSSTTITSTPNQQIIHPSSNNKIITTIPNQQINYQSSNILPTTITTAFFAGTYTLSITSPISVSTTATISNNQIILQCCNKISITFSIQSNGTFNATNPITMTKMACPSSNDSYFINAILTADKLTKFNGGFYLICSGTTIATFKTISTINSISTVSNSPNMNSISTVTNSVSQSNGQIGYSTSVSSHSLN